MKKILVRLSPFALLFLVFFSPLAYIDYATNTGYGDLGSLSITGEEFLCIWKSDDGKEARFKSDWGLRRTVIFETSPDCVVGEKYYVKVISPPADNTEGGAKYLLTSEPPEVRYYLASQ